MVHEITQFHIPFRVQGRFRTHVSLKLNLFVFILKRQLKSIYTSLSLEIEKTEQ